MSGRGKGGKGLGKTMRHKVLRDTLLGVTKPAMKRLARRSGCKRISLESLLRARDLLKVELRGLVKDCVTCMEHSRRKTVTVGDVVHSITLRGSLMYGY